jgi:hypothetical protein
LLGRNAEELQHMGNTSSRIGAAAKSEQIDSVAWLPSADNREVAVNYSGGESYRQRVAN